MPLIGCTEDFWSPINRTGGTPPIQSTEIKSRETGLNLRVPIPSHQVRSRSRDGSAWAIQPRISLEPSLGGVERDSLESFVVGLKFDVVWLDSAFYQEPEANTRAASCAVGRDAESGSSIRPIRSRTDFGIPRRSEPIGRAEAVGFGTPLST